MDREAADQGRGGPVPSADPAAPDGFGAEGATPSGGWGRALGAGLLILFLIGAITLAPIPLSEIRIAGHLIVGGLIAGYFAWLVRRGRTLPATPFDRPILAGLAAAVLATAFGIQPRLALDWVTPLLGPVLLYFALVDTLRRGWLTTVYLPASLGLTACLVAIALTELAGVFFGVGPLAGPEGWLAANGGLGWPPILHRIRQPLPNPNFLAGLLVCLLPFVWLGWTMAGRRGERIGLAALLGLTGLGLVLTGSRAGLLGGVAGLAATVLLAGIGRRPAQAPGHGAPAGVRLRRHPLRLGLAVVVIGVAGLGLIALAGGRSLALDSARQNLFAQAATAFLDRPLAGIGPRNFPLDQVRRNPGLTVDQIFQAPHSLPLTVAAEAGLAGSLAVIWLIGAFGTAIVRQWPAAGPARRRELAAAAGAAAGLATHGLFDAFLMLPWFWLAGAWIAAVVAAPLARIRPTGGTVPARARLIAGAALAIALFGWQLAAFAGYTDAAIAAAAGRIADADAAFAGARQIDPAYPAIDLEAGLALSAADPPASAPAVVARLSAGLAALADDPVGRTRLGLARLAAGDRDGAAADLRRALDLGPPDAGTALAIARGLAATGDRAGAEAAGTHAIDHRPALLADPIWPELGIDRPRLVAGASALASEPWQRARILAAAGAVDQTRDLFAESAARRPTVAAFGLACLDLIADRPVRALDQIAAAEARAPEEPFLRALAGRALIRAGRVADGERRLRQARWLLAAANEPAAAATVGDDLDRLAGRAGSRPAVSVQTDARLQTILNRVTVPVARLPEPPIERGRDGALPLSWPVPNATGARTPLECPA